MVDDYATQSYQDDIDGDDDVIDPVMQELNDDPVEELGVPAEEFKAELDDIAIDEGNLESKADNDAEARIEDSDEDLADTSY